MSDLSSINSFKFKNSKEKWHHIIFGSDTVEGRRFDIWLLWAILLSVVVLMADSVNELRDEYHDIFLYIEYFFTLIFTLEYIVRLWVSESPKKYAFSFYGIIDLISTLPTYLSFFFPAIHLFRILRTVRLLRVFKVLRLTSFMGEAKGMGRALKRSGAKITVFFGAVLIVVIVAGAVMFAIEPAEAGFTSIPRSIYWAIVTLTTVGYGDIAPVTSLGQFLSAALMILGYAIIAVPTGIVSVEMNKKEEDTLHCAVCDAVESNSAANYCKECGSKFKKE